MGGAPGGARERTAPAVDGPARGGVRIVPGDLQLQVTTRLKQVRDPEPPSAEVSILTLVPLAGAGERDEHREPRPVKISGDDIRAAVADSSVVEDLERFERDAGPLRGAIVIGLGDKVTVRLEGEVITRSWLHDAEGPVECLAGQSGADRLDKPCKLYGPGGDLADELVIAVDATAEVLGNHAAEVPVATESCPEGYTPSVDMTTGVMSCEPPEGADPEPEPQPEPLPSCNDLEIAAFMACLGNVPPDFLSWLIGLPMCVDIADTVVSQARANGHCQ